MSTNDPTGPAVVPSDTIEQQTRQWGMFLHLSLILGYVVPVAGLAAPIIIWQTKKNELPLLDERGKNATNWMISLLIYCAAYVMVSIVLTFVGIGIVLLMLWPLILVASVVPPVIARINANNGEVWRYPLAIQFLK